MLIKTCKPLPGHNRPDSVKNAKRRTMISPPSQARREPSTGKKKKEKKKRRWELSLMLILTLTHAQEIS